MFLNSYILKTHVRYKVLVCKTLNIKTSRDQCNIKTIIFICTLLDLDIWSCKTVYTL